MIPVVGGLGSHLVRDLREMRTNHVALWKSISVRNRLQRPGAQGPGGEEGGQCDGRKVRRGERSEQIREITVGPSSVRKTWACAVDERGALREVGPSGI